MSNEKVAEVFVGKPLRVTLEERDRLRAEDAARVSVKTVSGPKRATSRS
jgi:hypothetical protein